MEAKQEVMKVVLNHESGGALINLQTKNLMNYNKIMVKYRMDPNMMPPGARYRFSFISC